METSIIQDLLDHNLENLVSEIFWEGSEHDLRNIKLVCKAWKDYVNQRMRKKLLLRWTYPNPVIRWSMQLLKTFKVISLKWDTQNIFMGTSHGNVVILDKTTQEELFQKILCRGNEAIHLDFTSEYLVAVSKTGAMLLVARPPKPFPGSQLKAKITHTETQSIIDVKIWKTQIATRLSTDFIKVYQIEDLSVPVLKIIEGCSPRMECNLEFDCDCLLSGFSNQKLIAYAYPRMNKVKSWDCAQAIICVAMAYPLVAACCGQVRGDNTIQIWDIEHGAQVVFFKTALVVQLKMTAYHIILHNFEDSASDESWEDDANLGEKYTGRIRVWNLRAFIQNLNDPPVRKIESKESLGGNCQLQLFHVNQTSMSYSDNQKITYLQFCY